MAKFSVGKVRVAFYTAEESPRIVGRITLCSNNIHNVDVMHGQRSAERESPLNDDHVNVRKHVPRVGFFVNLR